MKIWLKNTGLQIIFVLFYVLLFATIIYIGTAFPQPADPDDYTDRGPQGANNRFGQ